MKRALILGVCILISSIILSADKISNLLQYGNGNVLELTSGKINLGEVYNERVKSTYKVVFAGEEKASISVTAYTPNLYNAAYENFIATLEGVNKSRERKDEEQLSKEEASWVNSATIYLTTTVTYRSEFQPEFELIIDETTMTHKSSSKTIMQYLEDLQLYSDKMMMEYEQHNSFL